MRYFKWAAVILLGLVLSGCHCYDDGYHHRRHYRYHHHYPSHVYYDHHYSYHDYHGGHHDGHGFFDDYCD